MQRKRARAVVTVLAFAHTQHTDEPFPREREREMGKKAHNEEFASFNEFKSLCGLLNQYF